ncbi:sensor histidine kinase [Pelosinus fermentans]|uniref:histidine kinase n=1 Tax=Pelosinus fermentans JBW45 TaxID=1192197 RepID=I9DD52_9FIRM|nr:sensor histidine kinase KdpD [Pelosinus fermentans]AJQ25828.1 osmosensitive K+ channel signal transduction histidine kinase [Pelosinus fermentans JBW45]
MPDESKEKKRPDPDVLLAKLNKETRGKLTVFLGAAAGVGKTYTMLEAAHEMLASGVDVVIGWVETHKRQETEKMVEGLPRLPAKEIDYRGRNLHEMDIDAILVRRPKVVLVDELAHTNVAGSRHVRRFQDVEEILNAGIDVATTLNIQHIETLNDIVAQITGVKVRETVPDRIVEQADQVQLIDIPPNELIKRLKEGKIYMPHQAELALHKFFRPGNINALRELSLRFTAYRVDKELNEYMQEHDIPGPWPAGERVMVCVSASPFSAQLIRAARRLARGLQAELLAVHIDTPRRSSTSEGERDRIFRNMRLAEELGAKTISIVGKDLTEEILRMTREHNVTHLVVGKPLRGRLWEWLNGGAVVDKLIRYSGGINIHVIQGNTEVKDEPKVKTIAPTKAIHWWHYIAGLLMIILMTAGNWWWRHYLEPMHFMLLYLLPVLLSAVWWGKGPSYVTALCSVLFFDFFFISPIFTFNISDLPYMWSLPLFLLISFIIGGQTEKLRVEVTLARQREKTTGALYSFSREIAAIVDIGVIVGILAEQVWQTLDKSVAVFLPQDEKLVLAAEAGPGKIGEDAGEKAVAVWAFEHGEIAGHCTDTLPGARYMYLPLTTSQNTVGVLGIEIHEEILTSPQKRLMEAWAGLAAIAVERVKLAEQARQAALLAESDQLRTALFNSISHELRTPLSSIIGAISGLMDTEGVYSENDKKELLETVKEGADRMNRLVVNLLDTARLESGMMQLKKDWCDIEDITGSALRRVGECIKGRALLVNIAPDLPMIKADCVLLEQVVVNLLDNACKYSVQGSEIVITASQDTSVIQVSIADRGIGIPTENLMQIFDKFYRVEQLKTVNGTGLGLSICKGIIEAHGGTIQAENRPGGGTVMTFILPWEEQPPMHMA